MKTNIHLWQYLGEFLLECEGFGKKFLEKIKIYWLLCINKNWPRTFAHAKHHCTAVHPLRNHASETSPWREIRERLSPKHNLEFHLLLQFEQTRARDFIKVTILQHTSCYTLQAPLVHYQAAYSCTNVCLKLSARSSAAENSSLCNIYVVDIIHSLVFSRRGRAGRNRSPVMWPVWLWHTASWASAWG